MFEWPIGFSILTLKFLRSNSQNLPVFTDQGKFARNSADNYNHYNKDNRFELSIFWFFLCNSFITSY